MPKNTNADLLIEGADLARMLADNNIRVVDARPEAEYRAGHITGAVNIPVEATFDPDAPKGIVGSARMIESLFSEKGISNENRVVIYDIGKDTRASRVFWTLEYYGHTKAAVLNGGYAKWQKDNLPTAKEELKASPAKFVAQKIDQKISSRDQVLAILGKPGVAIVDARSPQEYSGQDLRAKRGGRIPGAVNIEWVTLFSDDSAPVLKSATEIEKMYVEKGVAKDKSIYVYCQTAQRSSVTYLSLRLLGYQNISNYGGSWQEWGNDPNVPIEN